MKTVEQKEFPESPDYETKSQVARRLASLSSEVMLSRMFGVEQFKSPGFRPGKQVPFFFVWLPKTIRHFSSAFALTWRQLQTEHAAIVDGVRRNQTAAFLLEGKPHVVPAEGKSWII